jgi:hypothetical protein
VNRQGIIRFLSPNATLPGPSYLGSMLDRVKLFCLFLFEGDTFAKPSHLPSNSLSLTFALSLFRHPTRHAMCQSNELACTLGSWLCCMHCNGTGGYMHWNRRLCLQNWQLNLSPRGNHFSVENCNSNIYLQLLYIRSYITASHTISSCFTFLSLFLSLTHSLSHLIPVSYNSSVTIKELKHCDRLGKGKLDRVDRVERVDREFT